MDLLKIKTREERPCKPVYQEINQIYWGNLGNFARGKFIIEEIPAHFPGGIREFLDKLSNLARDDYDKIL